MRHLPVKCTIIGSSLRAVRVFKDHVVQSLHFTDQKTRLREFKLFTDLRQESSSKPKSYMLAKTIFTVPNLINKNKCSNESSSDPNVFGWLVKSEALGYVSRGNNRGQAKGTGLLGVQASPKASCL